MNRTWKNGIEIARLQLEHLLVRMDFWIVIVTLFAFFSVILKGTGEGLRAMEQSVSVWEVLPGLFSNPDVLFVLIGSLFLISDIPRGHAGYEVQVLRASRGAWHAAQWLYAALTGAVYFLLLNLCAIPFYLPAMNVSVTSRNGAVGDLFWVWISYLVLFVLVTVFFAGVCCICNLLSLPAGIGILIDGIFIFLYLLSMTGRSAGILSPIEVYSKYTGQSAAGFGLTAVYFFVLNTMLFAVGAWSVKRKDIIFEASRS